MKFLWGLWILIIFITCLLNILFKLYKNSLKILLLNHLFKYCNNFFESIYIWKNTISHRNTQIYENEMMLWFKESKYQHRLRKIIFYPLFFVFFKYFYSKSIFRIHKTKFIIKTYDYLDFTMSIVK